MIVCASTASTRQTMKSPYFRIVSVSGILATGGGTPLREDNLLLLRQAGVPIILLAASPEVTYQRLQQQDNRPLGNELGINGIWQ